MKNAGSAYFKELVAAEYNYTCPRDTDKALVDALQRLKREDSKKWKSFLADRDFSASQSPRMRLLRGLLNF